MCVYVFHVSVCYHIISVGYIATVVIFCIQNYNEFAIPHE